MFTKKESNESGHVDFFKYLEGREDVVFQNLFRKKRLLDAQNDEHKKIRPLLISLPGIMRGVIGGGTSFCLAGFWT